MPSERRVSAFLLTTLSTLMGRRFMRFHSAPAGAPPLNGLNCLPICSPLARLSFAVLEQYEKIAEHAVMFSRPSLTQHFHITLLPRIAHHCPTAQRSVANFAQLSSAVHPALLFNYDHVFSC